MGLEPGASRFAAEEIEKLRSALQLLAAPDSIAAVVAAAEAVTACLKQGGKVMFCGNGGSAADAQHMAAELVGRQNYDRPPTSGIALTADTSALTAIANDYGYEQVFARQVQALGSSGDVVVGISTSGRSANVVAALHEARRGGMVGIAMTGQDPRDMAAADIVLALPAMETGKVQELQLVAGHIIFALVERALFPLTVAAAAEA
jgi:D-sedoheptulose 7-phosphate isomerase